MQNDIIEHLCNRFKQTLQYKGTPNLQEQFGFYDFSYLIKIYEFKEIIWKVEKDCLGILGY